VRTELELKRTDSSDDQFAELVRYLDAELAERDGSEHAYYAQFNKVAAIRHVIVAYSGGRAISCGGIKEFGPGAMEVKRMYTLPEYRGKGVAAAVLNELEKWAAELACTRCVLETGMKQPEAIRLYEKSGYSVIPNYGQYTGLENSVCFEKKF
jgi:putative acetyltransferase